MINNKKAKSMNFIIKKLILILITISFLDYFKNVNPNLQIFASESTGININYGDSIKVKGNIRNLKDRKEMYEKAINLIISLKKV